MYNLYNDCSIHTICRLLSRTIYLTYKHDAMRIKVCADDWNLQPDILNVIYAVNIQMYRGAAFKFHYLKYILMISAALSHLRPKYLKDL